MSTHSPKTGALMAYESGALSPRGRARVERHLSTCTLCRRELAAIQAYEATVDHIRAGAWGAGRAPELDWSRIELGLEREAQTQAKKHRRGWALPAAGVVLAAAAAALLLVHAPATQPSGTPIATHAQRVVDAAPTTMVALEPAAPTWTYAGAVVTLVAGASAVGAGDAVQSGDAARAHEGAPLTAGDALATIETSSLHARLAPGLGIALEPSTEVHLASVAGEPVPQLTLDHGRMSAVIHEARTVILAGAYRIEIESASFVIDLDQEDGAVRVDVRDGDVHITGPSTDETLTAPARFPRAMPGASGERLDASEPVGTSETYDAQPLLHVARPGIVRWQIGDMGVQGAGDLAMRVGVGPTTVTGWDARGRMFRASLMMTAEGLDLTPDELTPQAPRVHAGTLDRDEILPVFDQHRQALQRCYDHELRTTPTLEARVVTRISLEMTGSVDGVTLSGDPIPATMERCLTNQIQTWIFPPPHGGPFTFSVPIPFNH